jgi:branched-chain amino acid transport system ATP-binding protein
MAQLEVNGIDAFYGSIHALRNVSITVDEGEIVTLIGANGAGKTTTLNCISGLVRPRSGTVKLEGQDLTKVLPHHIVEQGVVQVPEGRRMFARLTVDENLRMGGYSLRTESDVRAGIERAYEMFPRLRERRGQVAGTLSGGEQQMLAMGRALMAKPKVLLLDEPSMGLAPRLVAEIFDIVVRLNQDEGVAVLLAEQNAAMALRVAESAYIMENGRVVLDGDRQTISENEDVKEFYLGLSGVGQRKSYRDVKHYRRRKRWLS